MECVRLAGALAHCFGFRDSDFGFGAPKAHTLHDTRKRRKICPSARVAGESLTSVLMGVALASLLFLALAAVYLYSTRSFADLGNYVELDSKTRLALDLMSRDIRQADKMTVYASNAVTFQSGTNQLSFTYSPDRRTLTRQLGSATSTLLTSCDNVRFDIFQRNLTNGTYDYYPTATSTNCKVVQVSLACSRSLLGRKADNTVVQSAKIVIRKQR